MADPRAKLMKAQQLAEQRRFAEAELLLRTCVSDDPRNPQGVSALARVLEAQGKDTQALHFAQQAAALAPDRAFLHEHLGGILLRLRRPDESVRAYQRACDLDPQSARLRNGLGIAFAALSRADDAEQAFRESIALDPRAIDPRRNLARVLFVSARIEEAVREMRYAVSLAPNMLLPYLDLAPTLNYCPDISREEVFEAHVAGARLVHADAGAARPPPPRAAAENRPLRVGIMSPDLKTHSVAFFIEPFFEHHDRARVSIWAYDTSGRPDDTTARLRAHSAGWRDASALSDDELAQRIRNDQIDILIDLAGWTTGHRLGVLARRAAPMQTTYIGYPNTTGLRTVDVRIVDSLTDPPGTERFATERLLRLDPIFLCYRPPAIAPPVSPLPAAERGRVTFGSFNLIRKMNPLIVSTWARAMNTSPESRLILKGPGLETPSVRERLRGWFTGAGVESDRIEMIGHITDASEHLGVYGRIDIAFDTFPYHGTTTTCEALYMGVPTVSLIGNSHPSRVGLSLLTAVDLANLAVQDEAGFVQTTHALASDLPSLAALRADLRTRLCASPLCDGPSFAARLTDALLAAWRDTKPAG